MEIDWRPGIGDPTIWGWITVVAYFLGAGLSVRAAQLAQFSGRFWQRESMFWLIVTILMLGLGINKQLDLQSLLTDVARVLAKKGGWYQDRRVYQEAAIFLVAATGGVALLAIIFALRRSAFEMKVAAAGLSAVICFVVIRAASFHHVDAFISRDLVGFRYNLLLEISGIALVTIGALRYAQRRKRRAALR